MTATLDGGEPQQAALAGAELDRQLAQLTAGAAYDMLSDVRERLEARLARDASLEGIARELRISARTLRRRLDERGASFQQLLREVRHARAVAYLADTAQSVERVAAQLGYGDPSNFRRAFRRWTGLAPSDFRARRGCKNPHDYG
jgi:AraC-like DNA-binding protein